MSTVTRIGFVYLAIQIRENPAQLKLQISHEIVRTRQKLLAAMSFPVMNRIWRLGHNRSEEHDALSATAERSHLRLLANPDL